MQEINESVRKGFLHHNTLIIRIHDVDILFRFYYSVNLIIINIRGTVFRNRLEMVFIKAEFTLLSSNQLVLQEHFGHSFVGAKKQIPVEENQIETTHGSPKVVTVYQTKNGCHKQQNIEYGQKNDNFLVLKTKRPVETHELLFGIEAFYGI